MLMVSVAVDCVSTGNVKSLMEAAITNGDIVFSYAGQSFEAFPNLPPVRVG
jgi:hypothetical protein